GRSATNTPSDKLEGIRKLSMNFAEPMPLQIVEISPRQEHSNPGTAEHHVRLHKEHSAPTKSGKHGQESRGQHEDPKRVGSFCLFMSFGDSSNSLPILQSC